MTDPISHPDASAECSLQGLPANQPDSQPTSQSADQAGEASACSRPPGRPKDETLAERRRQEIIPCAIHHFARVGYHVADMDQIATALGCAKGTLYRYFTSKQDLFEAAVDHVMEQLLQSNPAHDTGDLVADMTRSITNTLGFFDHHPHYVELLLQERAAFKDRDKPSFFEFCDADNHNWAARLTQGIKDGIIRDIPIATIRQIGVTLVYGSIFTNYFARNANSFEAQAKQINQIFFHGILTPQASCCYLKKDQHHAPTLTPSADPSAPSNPAPD